MRFCLAPVAGLVLGCLSLFGVAGAEEIESRPFAVVELFTSQGCASCPPADALFAELDARPGIIALAYHVDYWDYIGWKDTFGDRSFSDLQRAYARSWGKNRIYTPQLVINGTRDVVGSRRDAIEHALSGSRFAVKVDLTYEEGVLDISIAGIPGSRESMVYLVTFKEREDVLIERGENRGKTITYVQVVTSRQLIGMWDPGYGSHLKLPVSELFRDDSDGVAILVQEQNDGLPGPIVGAALFQM